MLCWLGAGRSHYRTYSHIAAEPRPRDRVGCVKDSGKRNPEQSLQNIIGNQWGCFRSKSLYQIDPEHFCEVLVGLPSAPQFYEVRLSSVNLREPENTVQTVKLCDIRSVHSAKHQYLGEGRLCLHQSGQWFTGLTRGGTGPEHPVSVLCHIPMRALAAFCHDHQKRNQSIACISALLYWGLDSAVRED